MVAIVIIAIVILVKVMYGAIIILAYCSIILSAILILIFRKDILKYISEKLK